jgi:hypothetical protein
MPPEALADRLGVRKVNAVVGIGRVRGEARKARFLDSRVVVVIMIVDSDDLVTTLEES